MEEEYKTLAEQYFCSVYGDDPTVIDDLASEEIVATYPIFEELFGRPALRGRAAGREPFLMTISTNMFR